MIGKKELAAVKKKIEQYYYNEKVIAWNKAELERLQKRLQEIDKDRNNPFLPVSLHTDLQGVRYDKVGKNRSLPQSPMEKEIDKIYTAFDRTYEETQQKIIELKINIPKREDERKETEFYIHLLNEENRTLLKYKYEDKKSITEIALLLHLSKSTVCRSFYEIYEWLYKMMAYDGIFEKT